MVNVAEISQIKNTGSLVSYLTKCLHFLQDAGEEEAAVRVLMKADPSCRESLQAEAEVDPMDGEQTWPTESELLEAEGAAFLEGSACTARG